VNSKQKKRALFRRIAQLQPRNSLRVIDAYLRDVDPKDLDVLLYKGYSLDSISEFDKALGVYRRVLRIDRENVPALIQLGAYYSNIKRDNKKALRCYARALRLIELGRYHWDKEDEFVDACTSMADVLLALKRPMEAVTCVVNGLQKYPADSALGDALQRAQAQYEVLRDRKFGKRYHVWNKRLASLRLNKLPN
jgi:tetratricopeptide (TPR) repeat protein